MTGKSAQYASLTHILNLESSSPVLHFPLFIELIPIKHGIANCL
jgi:hypothetical protein